ncbi:MAG: glycosyltransferase family 2 protein [Chloroflexi bacterium]|nr:glycosyltransferase family 2 protein [Chloroflexota bacterium]
MVAERLDLAIVIVSYNVCAPLRACLRSVFASDAWPAGWRGEVVVVDNGSVDDSVAMVRADFPQVALLTEERNRGFAWANNLAIRALANRNPRYVLLLNPDTELPPDALRRMLEFIEAHPRAGAVGPRLVRSNGQLDLACRRSFPSPAVALARLAGLSGLFPRSRWLARYNLTYLDPLGVYEVDSVVGAFMLVRGETIRDVGPLDEAFFMYGEDLDWAFRMKQRGWQVLYNGAVTILHHKGASSGGQRSLRTLLEFYRAMLVFFSKHYARTVIWPARWVIVGGICLRALVAILVNYLRWQTVRRLIGAPHGG